MEESGIVIGAIELGISTTQLESARDESLKRLGLIAFIEMVLVALFSLGLGSYLTRQLARLEHAARAVAEGELGHQVEVSGSDEIAQTIHSFNRMSLQLHGSFKELTQSESLYRESQERLDGLVASLFEGVRARVSSASRNAWPRRQSRHTWRSEMERRLATSAMVCSSTIRNSTTIAARR